MMGPATNAIDPEPKATLPGGDDEVARRRGCLRLA
jgi:hypothetical protein